MPECIDYIGSISHSYVLQASVVFASKHELADQLDSYPRTCAQMEMPMAWMFHLVIAHVASAAGVSIYN